MVYVSPRRHTVPYHAQTQAPAKGKSPDVLIDVALFFPEGGHVKYTCKTSRRNVLCIRMHIAFREGGINAARAFADFLATLSPENR